jgi:hypothetical protein
MCKNYDSNDAKCCQERIDPTEPRESTLVWVLFGALDPHSRSVPITDYCGC